MPVRSDQATKYHRLYGSPRWIRLRKRVLLRDLFTCTEPGCGRLVTGKRAQVHHIRPHRGDVSLFYDEENCRTVCAECHGGPIQADEARGYSTAVGLDGWPVDRFHPSNRRGEGG